MDLAPRLVPLSTPDLPGVGGLVRLTPEDFRVEELPLYEPSGEGDHLYVEVEKRGRNTADVARELATALGAGERDVGYAGLKDNRAVSVQRFSVPLPPRQDPAAVLERAAALTGQGWAARGARRHVNKLKPGHLRGNRFVIAIRGCSPGGAEGLARAQAVCAALRAQGTPNLFGPQRFGKRGDNAALGAAILARAPEARRALRDRFLRRLALSALQSELFNRCLAARLRDGLMGAALEGDVLKKRATGGLFVCEDPAIDGPRVAAAEVDPCGPLPGHEIYAARGAALAREEGVIAEAGVDPRSFAVGGDEMRGTRRPYRIPLGDLAVRALPDDALELTFELPRGSYAIAVLREVMKVGVELEEAEG
jgi:tRNA pseudouridine13 synthase